MTGSLLCTAGMADDEMSNSQQIATMVLGAWSLYVVAVHALELKHLYYQCHCRCIGNEVRTSLTYVCAHAGAASDTGQPPEQGWQSQGKLMRSSWKLRPSRRLVSNVNAGHETYWVKLTCEDPVLCCTAGCVCPYAQECAHPDQPQNSDTAHIQALLRPDGAAAAETQHPCNQWPRQAHEGVHDRVHDHAHAIVHSRTCVACTRLR